MASEGLRVCKIVPSVWSGWKSPCAFELLRFGAEPGFRLLFSVFTDALKINKKPSAEIYRKNGEIKCDGAQEPGRMEPPKSASQKGASPAFSCGGAGGIFGSPELCRETGA